MGRKVGDQCPYNACFLLQLSKIFISLKMYLFITLNEYKYEKILHFVFFVYSIS
jgi:hypothetical protein